MLFLTHIDDIFIKISEMHNLKALKWTFYVHMHVKNYEKWKLFILMHIKTHFDDIFHAITSNACKSGHFRCNNTN